MKKFMLMLFAAIFSVGMAVADGRQCSTSQGTARLDNQTRQSGDNRQVCVHLSYTKPSDGSHVSMRVLVDCYDAMTDEKVSVQSVYLTSGGNNSACFGSGDGIKPNHAYYFEVRRCD